SVHHIEWDVDTFTVNTCGFTMDNSELITVSFHHQNSDWLDVAADQFELDGHRVGADDASGTVEVVVGPEFQVGEQSLVPTVIIFGSPTDTQHLRVLAQAVADEY